MQPTSPRIDQRFPSMKTPAIGLFVLASIGLFSGCSSMLPSGEEVVKSPWASFDEAKASFDQITPNESMVEGLTQLGFDPYKTPNIKILNHLDVRGLFNYEPGFDGNYHPGVIGCMNAKEACQAYDAQISNIQKKRVGNFLLDLMVVKRVEHKTGWKFRALILLVDDQVIYKLWSGSPMLDETSRKTNPLGPFQEIGPALIN